MSKLFNKSQNNLFWIFHCIACPTKNSAFLKHFSNVISPSVTRLLVHMTQNLRWLKGCKVEISLPFLSLSRPVPLGGSAASCFSLCPEESMNVAIHTLTCKYTFPYVYLCAYISWHNSFSVNFLHWNSVCFMLCRVASFLMAVFRCVFVGVPCYWGEPKFCHPQIYLLVDCF